MLNRTSLGAVFVLAALCVATVDCQAWMTPKYPDFSGNGAQSAALVDVI
jgi:hypothetical protein